MIRTKVFQSSLNQMEKELNTWLSRMHNMSLGFKVVLMEQEVIQYNSLPADMITTIVYSI